MAHPYVIRVRQGVRGPVGGAIFVWSLVTTWCLVDMIATPTPSPTARAIAFWATVALGVILGLQRRSGMSFIAPIVLWMVAWFPQWIGWMVRDGFLKGFFIGGAVALTGWLPLGAGESVVLYLVSTVVRFLSRPFRRTRDVVIIGPDEI